MRPLGIDLASLPARTAACSVRWSTSGAEVEGIEQGVTDERLEEEIQRHDKVGIDVPLGWPDAFVTAIAAHHAGAGWRTAGLRELRFRRTDLHVLDEVGWWPLSVSTDLIAVPALRAAALLDRVVPGADRSGEGLVVEVYPAAALKRWGFVSRGYKRAKGAAVRAGLVESFRQATAEWLHVPAVCWDRCVSSDDAFDALVAALVARAAALKLCDPCPTEARAVAGREGWIALPDADGLHRLT
ncbi:MAG: DUF429 domain-containing protein [Gaiellaceae bacterium]